MIKNDIWCSLVLGLMVLSSCLNRVEVAPSTAVESIPGSFAGEEFKLLNPQFLYCMKRRALFIKMDEHGPAPSGENCRKWQRQSANDRPQKRGTYRLVPQVIK